MLSIFSPKLQGFKKLSFTNVYCSVPKSSDPICAIYLQTRCDPSILNRTSHAIACIVTLLAVPGFATCSSQSWAEALCMLVLLAVQKHSKIWKKNPTPASEHEGKKNRGQRGEDITPRMLQRTTREWKSEKQEEEIWGWKYRTKLGLPQKQEYVFLDIREKEFCDCEPKKEKGTVIKPSREHPGKQRMPC